MSYIKHVTSLSHLIVDCRQESVKGSLSQSSVRHVTYMSYYVYCTVAPSYTFDSGIDGVPYLESVGRVQSYTTQHHQHQFSCMFRSEEHSDYLHHLNLFIHHQLINLTLH